LKAWRKRYLIAGVQELLNQLEERTQLGASIKMFIAGAMDRGARRRRWWATWATSIISA
jgi:hypothetical protein